MPVLEKILSTSSAGYSRLLDAVYPRRCLACQRWMPRGEPGFLCAECYQSMEFIVNPCARCGCERGPYSKNTGNCPSCRSVALHFDSVRSVGAYSTPLKEIVHALKYRREMAAAPVLGEILFEAVRDWPGGEFAEVVVPVPLHKARLRRRTFNQSALIGGILARRMQLPFSQALARTRMTQSQTELSPSARRKNVKDAFAAARPKSVKGRQVLLVDDVITSGATASECAKALKAAGAARVYAASIAR